MDKAKDEEVFAELVPELKTLARGWTWRLCEAIPGSRETAEYIRSFSFFAVITVALVILWTTIDTDRFSSFDKVPGAIVVCALLGLLILGIGAAVNSEIRDSALKKKAAHYSSEEREQLVEAILTTLKQILKGACIDAETKHFIEQQDLNPDDVTSSLNFRIKWLREDVEQTIEELLSPKACDIAAALRRLAGSDSLSIAARIRGLREAQAKVRSEAEDLLRERETAAKLEAIMNEHLPGE